MRAVDITRWPGKPTSGRYVDTSSRLSPGYWWWQCDLCGADADTVLEGDGWFDTMQEAFADCLEHAKTCPFVSKNRRTTGAAVSHPNDEKREQ